MGTLLVVLVLAVVVAATFGPSDEVEVIEEVEVVEDGYPPFEGGVIEVECSSDVMAKLEGLKNQYVFLARDHERALGLNENEPFEITTPAGEDLYSLRYRTALLAWLMDHGGRVDTSELYDTNATCGQPYFYPEVFIASCDAFQQDLANRLN